MYCDACGERMEKERYSGAQTGDRVCTNPSCPSKLPVDFSKKTIEMTEEQNENEREKEESKA